MRSGILSMTIILLSLFCIFSCEASRLADGDFVPVKFAAEVSVGEDHVMWKDGDGISLHNGKKAPVNRGTRLVCSSSKGETKSVTFEGFLKNSETFYAAMPYSNVTTWASDGSISLPIEIRAAQTAYEHAAGVNKEENIFVSRVAGTKGKMNFYPAYPLLKVTFDAESPLVSSIVVKSASGANLCGKYGCSVDVGEYCALDYVSHGASEVVLSSFDGECPFNEGAYYIGIAPGEYADGDLTFTYNYTNGKSATFPLDLPSVLKSGLVYDCGVVEVTEESGSGSIQNPPAEMIEDKYDIYLCIGQSNMAGRGYLLDSDLNKKIENVYLLDSDGGPVPATHPFNQYSTVRKEMRMQQMHLGYSFSLMMTNERGSRPVLLVCNARGGTSITEWGKDSYYYVEALNRTMLAMQYGRLKGVLWHQGCADSSKRVGQYMDLLKAMIGALRTDLGVSDLPVVVGELPYWRSTSAQFNEMIRTVSDHIPNTACVSAEGCGMRADADDPHFSREGLNILGKRYAEEMKKLINK